MKPPATHTSDRRLCAFCGKNYAVKPLMQYGDLSWVACCNCGMGSLEPYVSELDRQDTTIQSVYSNYLTEAAVFELVAREKARWIKRHLTETRVVLEIGPGMGAVARALRDMASTSYGAVEPNPSFAAELVKSGFRVYSGDPVESLRRGLKEIRSANKQVVVVMDNVLEHIPHPLDFLAGIQQQCLPGSVLLIEVPNETGIHWRYKIHDALRGERKAPTYPGHVNLFMRAGFKRFLERLPNARVRVSQHGIRSTAQLSYTMQRLVVNPRAKAACTFLRVLPVDTWLGIAYWLRAEVTF